eukprot:scaffold162614_cov50-Cyclotella_meneghiniana.AAC.1
MRHWDSPAAMVWMVYISAYANCITTVPTPYIGMYPMRGQKHYASDVVESDNGGIDLLNLPRFSSIVAK